MDLFNKLLFYYSLVLGTVVFIGTLFYRPSPENFVIAFAFLPVVLYFWILSSNPGQVSAGNWSIRLILITGILSALGLYAYSFSRQPVITAEEVAQEEAAIDEIKVAIEKLRDNPTDDAMLGTLESIREELTDIKDEQKSIKSLIGISDPIKNSTNTFNTDILSDGSLGSVSPKSSSTVVSVYEQASDSSKILTTLTYGKSYPYFQSVGSWYQIVLPGDTLGWVNSQGVMEVTNELP